MEYNDVDYYRGAADTLQRLQQGGIFICTSNRAGERNTMTIGWGSVTTIWGLPLFLVMVRPSRHTFGHMEETGEFTVCVPPEGRFGKALALCGTRSGRDMDKFKEAGLETAEGTVIKAPVILGSQWLYECRVIYKQPLDQAAIAPSVVNRYYGNGDFHTVYYGQIMASRTLKD